MDCHRSAVVVTLAGADSVVMGASITLTATVANAKDSSVTWLSSDADVAAVVAGVVTGIAPGTVTISATSVEDATKQATKNITVTDKYAFRISENAEYDVEAEDLDFTNATLRGDLATAGLGFIEQPYGDAAALTSGGESVRGVVSPSTFEIPFYSNKASAVDLKARFANYSAGFVLDDNVKFSLDGVSLGKTGAVFGGHSSDTDYWPWQDIEISDSIIAEGEHTLTIDVTGALPNADCFKFTASDFNDTGKYYVVSDNGVTTAEAENLDLTNLVIRSDLAAAGRTKDSLIEDATDASNGKSLGGIGAGTVLTVNLEFKDEAVVDIVARMADYGDTFNVDGNIAFALDGTALTSNGYTSFGHTDANLYWNWKNVDLGKTIVKKGIHTFTYTAIGNGINLDDFVFTAAYYGDVSKAGLQLTDNGAKTIEAENLEAKIGSFSSEAPTGDAAAITSGGLSIGNVAIGTVFEIPFVLGKKATVSIIAKMAKYEDPWDLDGNVTIQIDGTTVTTGYTSFGHTDANMYWNWKEITIERALMGAGSHTLTLTATNGFPNMDCLQFVTTGYGDDFSVSGDGIYTIEGEHVDQSNLISDGSGNSLIESSSNDSNGQSLGHVNGGYFEIPFYLENAAKVDIACVLSKYESYVIGEKYNVYVDAVETAFVDPTMTLGRASDGSNDWFNWKSCAVAQQTLSAGDHVFKFSFTNGAANVDCINFAVSGYGA